MENKSHDKHIIGDIPIYYINLNRSKDRKIKLEEYFKEHEFTNITRIEAVDGSLLDRPELEKQYNIQPTISKNEIGCALSHYKAIETVYNDQHEYALIIEDDCRFEYLKHQIIPLINLLSEKEDWEVIKLATVDRYYKQNSKTIKHIVDNKFNKEGGSSAVAYIINKKGCKKIIEEKKKITLHVSEINIFDSLHTYSIYPPYFTYPYYKENKSTIRLNNKGAHATQTLSKLFWDKYYNQLD